MRKLLAVIMILTMLLLPSCGDDRVRVAFLIYDARDTFISEMLKKMTSQIGGDIQVDIRDAANSQSLQNQQVVELLEQEAGVVIINAVDRMAASSIAEKCGLSETPVIFFNREPLGNALAGDRAYYVGAAADNQGTLQAEIAASLFGENYAESVYDRNGDGVVQIIILKGEQGHQDAELRTTNCVSRLTELGYQTEILAIEVADWHREEARDVMRTLYEQYGDAIELIFSNNDDMALGAIDYLLDIGVFQVDSAGYPQPFVMIGVDGTEVGLDAIDRGLLYGTVLNDSTAQADAIINLMNYLLEKKDLADFPYDITNDHFIYIAGKTILRADLTEYTY